VRAHIGQAERVIFSRPPLERHCPECRRLSAFIRLQLSAPLRPPSRPLVYAVRHMRHACRAARENQVAAAAPSAATSRRRHAAAAHAHIDAAFFTRRISPSAPPSFSNPLAPMSARPCRSAPDGERGRGSRRVKPVRPTPSIRRLTQIKTRAARRIRCVTPRHPPCTVHRDERGAACWKIISRR
jgi:hypothetical protein